MPAACLPDAFGLRQFGAVVDAERALEAGLGGDDIEALRAGYLDDVGQVILALGVVVADRVESFSAWLPATAIMPALQKLDFSFLRGAVLLLADGSQLAAFFDQPAITGRIGRAETDDHDGGTFRQFQPGHGQGIRVDQRCVAEHHQDIVVTL